MSKIPMQMEPRALKLADGLCRDIIDPSKNSPPAQSWNHHFETPIHINECVETCSTIALDATPPLSFDCAAKP